MDNWIKCSERLPEYDVSVLVCKDGKWVLHYHRVLYPNGSWLWIDSQYDAFDLAPSDVTHWQPLPEPPRE